MNLSIKTLGLALGIIALSIAPFQAQQEEISRTNTNLFRQLGTEIPTPNVYRTASGAPGHEYWQQQVDYDMRITLDDNTQRIDGSEVITYTNNSPDELRYLWLQLDQNVRAKASDSHKIRESEWSDSESFRTVRKLEPTFDGGFNIESVKDESGRALSYTIINTMMRVDLPRSLKSGSQYKFSVSWWYNINNRMEIGGRSGYEHFEENDNYLYTIAQFFPRLAVYSDNEGWQNKQFLGSGEFTVCFGDYRVAITVPSDHIVASTGELINPKTVLTSKQRKRFELAKTTTDHPVVIVTEEEARETEKTKEKGLKTWIFSADNVRDFGFATSRKFIWDAMVVPVGKYRPMAMSFYPKEGNPLWGQYSTKAVAQTLKTYSKHTIDYPYPVAISVHTKWIGMEYPMICFNGGRPAADGTYSQRTKHGMISVIIHEVGHNFFPMIINSDERQWTWMDEGLNTFVQNLAEQEYDRDYPSRRRRARDITDYMGGDKKRISPIMTNSESIYQFGPNAYSKPSVALHILRESVMGRDLFDFAFKEYSRRWAFKHPTPADFFRTMEDASGVDLDWFWRGWFYTNDHVDIALEEVKWMQIDTQNPDIESGFNKVASQKQPMDISHERDLVDTPETYLEADSTLNDYYTTTGKFEVLELDRVEYSEMLDGLSEEDKDLLSSGKNFYEITFRNLGGLVMPLIVEFEYIDGEKEIRRIPAEIWLMSEPTVTKVFATDKPAVRIVLDPMLETADCDLSNNSWPYRPAPTRFEVFKQQGHGYSRYGAGGDNPMQRAQKNEELLKEGGE
ncbi:MAG TPA: M1 family peptidase [Flavobacteriales bacterium]|nr:M1 family peptidase [Flavobacteriales bacterium]HIN41174.1 M1 family peptidase [Flavobacteriales bacterium]HIO15525.1 M1 family peptidase [Flavobacteriales bacterium]HIO59646.1 M1 family peptidase [Flavobacteriales bacterium]